MEVKLFANLAEIAGTRSTEVDVGSATTVRDALESIFEEYPDLRAEVLDGDGNPNEHINILVNGTNVLHEDDGLERSVEASDEIAIFPPVSGGQSTDSNLRSKTKCGSASRGTRA